jgi:hypothetical protein
MERTKKRKRSRVINISGRRIEARILMRGSTFITGNKRRRKP